MNTIHFTAYFCRLSGELFSDNVMISKPFSKYEETYYVGNEFLSDGKMSDVIRWFKADAQKDDNILGEWGNNNLQVNTVYVQTEDALLGLQNDKQLSEMFAYFGWDNLEIVYFCVYGGASCQCNGYKFIVHPDEDIHKYHPHVHVRRNGNETRYSLDTLTRFPNDTFSHEFMRDEKKVILPYLRKNQAKLRGFWDHYMNGYTLPIEDENGKQYYKES